MERNANLLVYLHQKCRMRVFIIAIFSFYILHASANDSIQVWLEQYNNAFMTQQYTEAENAIDKIISKWKIDNNEVDGTYITFLFYKLIALCSNHRFTASDEILHEIEDNWELTGMSKESEMYALLLQNKSFILEDKGADIDSILSTLLESLTIDEKIVGKRNVHIIPTLMRIAVLYGDKGNYIKSLAYTEEAISISKECLKPDDKNLSVYLLELSDSYSVVGDYGKAFEAAKEANSIIESYHKDDKLLYARSLLSLSLCYSDLCNYSKAIILCNKAISVSKEKGKNTVLRSSYDGLSRIYFAMGNYRGALESSLKALEFSESLGEYGSNAYMTILNNLSIYYNHLAEYDKAIDIQEKTIELSKKLHGSSSVDFATRLSNFASIYYNIEDYNKALGLEIQSYKIKEAAKDSVGCIMSLDGISLLYEKLGELPKALKFGKEAIEYCNRIIGNPCMSAWASEKEP